MPYQLLVLILSGVSTSMFSCTVFSLYLRALLQLHLKTSALLSDILPVWWFVQGVAPFKFGIIIAGFAVRDPEMVVVLGEPISIPTIHFIGEKDFMKRASGQLLTHFTVHIAVWHAGGVYLPMLHCAFALLRYLHNIHKRTL
jgi:hypothetical protein